MWEHQIHAPTVDVEVVAQVFAAHRRTLAMPSREAVAPRTGPPHDVLGLCLFPQREVGLIALFAHAGQLTTVVHDVFEVSSGQDAVFVGLVVFLHIEVDRAVALIGKAVGKDLLHQLLLLDDMPGGMWLDARRQHVECLHRRVVAVGIVLRHLHRLQLLQPCLLRDLVVALVGIVFQMAHVGDIAHVAHLITQVLEVTEEHVKGDGRPGMPQMWVAINRRTADIHAHIGRVTRLEQFLTSGERIVNQ